MGSPLGDFVRARRDTTRPESVGIPDQRRRRSPGLRRVDVAERAGISVEYLARIEQGRDIRPSISVVNALADALALDATERDHLRDLARISGGECVAGAGRPPSRRVRADLADTVRMLEPGVAVLTNPLGDILAHTAAYGTLFAGSGLFDSDVAGGHDGGAGRASGMANLTRFVFADRRARSFFVDWAAVADEQAFDLRRGGVSGDAEVLTAELTGAVGAAFTDRFGAHTVPPRGVLAVDHAAHGRLRFRRQVLDVPADGQRVVVFLGADDHTAEVVDGWVRPHGHRLRAIS